MSPDELQSYLDLFGIQKPWPTDASGRPVPACSFCANHPVSKSRVPAFKRTRDGIPYCNPCSRWVE